jgi:glycosyltransferase involved in cell wall biosynthesis
MDEIARLSERLVVMSEQGASLLRDVHGVARSKIDVIPHGIPTLPSAKHSKRQLGVEGKSVLLTFGLVSPDKGIEHVIEALPAILERYPDTLYIVVGATHPHVKARHGETYRDMLENRARQLRVADNMIFHNRFVSQQELTEFLSAADIYITPYLKAEQSTSGTLAYAVGSGKAVVSTPYAYARELLAGGRGVLVPWPDDDPKGIARAITRLLENDDDRKARVSAMLRSSANEAEQSIACATGKGLVSATTLDPRSSRYLSKRLALRGRESRETDGRVGSKNRHARAELPRCAKPLARPMHAPWTRHCRAHRL